MERSELTQALRKLDHDVKELDKVMTETAVVTKFDVGDMWEKLPEYTKRANELGIAKTYQPEYMIGKKLVLVTNLKPAKLRGVLSEGMILCAEDENGNLSLVSPEKAFGAGCEVR